jgi:hypothetical protein
VTATVENGQGGALRRTNRGETREARVAPMVPEIHMTAERMAALAADKPVTKRECGVNVA